MVEIEKDDTEFFLPFSNIKIFSKNFGKTIGSSGKISTNSIFVETDDLLNINQNIVLEFKLPNTHFKINTYGKVVNLITYNEKYKSNGLEIEYVIIDETDKKRLQDYIESNSFTENINSDEYTLADFLNIPDKDIFKKTKMFWSYIEDMKWKGNYTFKKNLLTASRNRIMLFDEVTGKKEQKINMGSGNYLGLSYHPKVIEAAETALKKYGNSSVGSPLHSGTYDVHVQLERKLAEMKGCEEVMLFPSGYAANLGCISALLMKEDVAILDRHVHRSIIDGCCLSDGTFRTFRHSNMGDLERVLVSCNDRYNGKMVIVDGVFSTEGDIGLLPEIVKLSKKYDAKVLVDDAHATGIIGEKGKGTLSYYDMEGEVDLIMGTLSKALGCLGGFIGSSKEVVNYLRHYARSAFFSCTLPPQIAATALTAIEIVESEPELIESLWQNVNYLKTNLELLGFNILNSESAIIAVIIGNDVIGKKMAMRMLEEGVYLSYFPYPAVSVGKERLRLTVMSTHTKDDLDTTIEIFEKVGKEVGIIGTGVSQDNKVSFAA